jgi:hypothetical protein
MTTTGERTTHSWEQPSQAVGYLLTGRYQPSTRPRVWEGHVMTTPRAQIDWTAMASLVTAVVGVMLGWMVGGWAALLAATLSLVCGFLALSRIKRNGHTGRWAAVVGIGFGAVVYAILIAYVAWDLIDPVELHP